MALLQSSKRYKYIYIMYNKHVKQIKGQNMSKKNEQCELISKQWVTDTFGISITSQFLVLLLILGSSHVGVMPFAVLRDQLQLPSSALMGLLFL